LHTPSSHLLTGHDVESEIETLLHQISDGRFADDRRHAMTQLKEMLQDNPHVRHSSTPCPCFSSIWLRL
jgi:hypothetical protein